MRKIYLLVIGILFLLPLFAQDKINQQLFLQNPRGLGFIPPLSKPGIVYQGKLYLGYDQLLQLYGGFKSPEMMQYLERYKANRNAAAVLGAMGFAIPIVNTIVSANRGKFNWYLFGASIVLGAGSTYFKSMAQRHLIESVMFFEKNGLSQKNATGMFEQPVSFNYTIALGRK